MIILGIILLLLAYLLPDFIPVPPNIDHALTVLGWVAIIAGLILWALGAAGRPVGGRRYWF
jgi:hypothetical protein